MLKQCDLENTYDEIKLWYNGYNISQLMYNPWSINHCIKKGGVIDLYWVDTSEYKLVKKLITKNI